MRLNAKSRLRNSKNLFKEVLMAMKASFQSIADGGERGELHFSKRRCQ